MTRHILALSSKANRALAKQGIDRAPEGYVVELREAKRSDEQNRALWSLLNQIQKQRPTHQGVKMSAELWKSVFMQAAGHEIVFVPTLDGDGMFPIGHRSSQLTKGEFADLLTVILAWTAKEDLTIAHFDADSSEAAPVVSERERAA